MKTALVVFLTVFLCLSARAQSAWTLKQCIEYGLQQHKSNDIYRNNIEKARQLTKENVGLYLPQVTGDLRFDNNLDLQTLIIPAGFFGPDERLVQFGNRFITTASIEAEQALFDRTLLVSFRGLKPNMAVANLNFQQNQEQLIYNIAQAYLQVYVLKEQIALLNENIRKFSKLKEITRLQVEQGVAKKTDADRVTVALNNVQSQLSVAESNYELLLNRLKTAIGMEISGELALGDSAGVSLPVLIPSLDADLNNKTEIGIMRNNIALLDVQKNRTSAGYFPRLSFYARYSAQAFSNEFSSAFSTWYDFSSVGLKLSVPVFDGLQKGAQIKQAKINIENAMLNLKLMEDGYKIQLQNAVAQLSRAKSNLDNNKENVQLAKEIFDASALAYQQGAAPLSDFLNSETAYKEAQLNYVTAMLNYYTAVIEHEKAKGTLTTFYQNL